MELFSPATIFLNKVDVYREKARQQTQQDNDHKHIITFQIWPSQTLTSSLIKIMSLSLKVKLTLVHSNFVYINHNCCVLLNGSEKKKTWVLLNTLI